MADISIEVNGIKFSNPFVIGSGPTSTNSKISTINCDYLKVVYKGDYCYIQFSDFINNEIIVLIRADYDKKKVTLSLQKLLK